MVAVAPGGRLEIMSTGPLIANKGAYTTVANPPSGSTIVLVITCDPVLLTIK